MLIIFYFILCTYVCIYLFLYFLIVTNYFSLGISFSKRALCCPVRKTQKLTALKCILNICFFFWPDGCGLKQTCYQGQDLELQHHLIH